MEPLRDQAEKAKRFLLLRDELRLLEISVWLEELEELNRMRKRIHQPCREVLECRQASRRIRRLFI